MVFFTQKHTTPSRSILKAFQFGSWALSAALFFGGPVRSQLGASPLVIEAEANRGQVQAVINVINTSDTPLRARIYTQPFTFNRDRGFEALPSNPNYLGPYLQFSPRELTVPPGVTRRVRIRALLAPNLPDGEYRAMVFTETLKEQPEGSNTNVGVITRVGTAVYVRKGDVSPNLAVDSASFNSEQKKIQLLVRNTGDASVRPRVSWTLKQGETAIRTGELSATTVIAQSDRNFLLENSAKEQSALPSGNYQLTGELIWDEGDNPDKLPFNVNLTIPAR